MPSKRLPACISSAVAMACAALPMETTKHAVVRVQVVQVFANAEHATIAIHMALECPVDAGFCERMLKQVTCCDPHVQGKLLAIGSR